jgi:hypothetical protein
MPNAAQRRQHFADGSVIRSLTQKDFHVPNPRDIAHDLIHQGLHVFPLRRREKVTLANCDRCHPRAAPCRDTGTPCPCWPTQPCHGFRAATHDPSVVDEWWRRWPRTNVGIYPWPSGHLVIDLDAKPVPVPPTLLPAALGLDSVRATSGVDLFTQVMRRYGRVDRLDTRITRTPSGGLHVWFSAPPEVTIRSSRGTVHPDGHVTGLGWQIDVRAHGGYVVAPGCATKQGTYQVIRDRPPMPRPDWLLWWLQATGLTIDEQPSGTASQSDQATDGATSIDRDQDRPPCPAAGRQTGVTTGASRSRAQRIAQAALASECRQIAQLRDGRKAALNKAAYKLGGYVTAGYLAEQDVRQALAQAGTAAGATRITASIEPGLAAGMKRPRRLDDLA